MAWLSSFSIELETGLDRGELMTGYEHHELASKPRWEMP